MSHVARCSASRSVGRRGGVPTRQPIVVDREDSTGQTTAENEYARRDETKTYVQTGEQGQFERGHGQQKSSRVSEPAVNQVGPLAEEKPVPQVTNMHGRLGQKHRPEYSGVYGVIRPGDGNA